MQSSTLRLKASRFSNIRCGFIIKNLQIENSRSQNGPPIECY